MVKGDDFTSPNADWGPEIIGGSPELGELLKSRGWWKNLKILGHCAVQVSLYNLNPVSQFTQTARPSSDLHRSSESQLAAAPNSQLQENPL